jgi:hypothetical protein
VAISAHAPIMRPANWEPASTLNSHLPG